MLSNGEYIFSQQAPELECDGLNLSVTNQGSTFL